MEQGEANTARIHILTAVHMKIQIWDIMPCQLAQFSIPHDCNVIYNLRACTTFLRNSSTQFVVGKIRQIPYGFLYLLIFLQQI
jgi:hypothetical protein